MTSGTLTDRRVLALLVLLWLLGPAASLRVLAPERWDAQAELALATSRCRSAASGPSVGAPPVWPCVEQSRAAQEEKLRAAVDKFKRHTQPGKYMLNASEPPPSDEGLGELRGSQPFVFGHLIAASRGVVREMERPVDNQVVMMEHNDTEERHRKFTRGWGVPESIVVDGAQFVMYYHRGQGGFLGRAESRDGIHWENYRELDINLDWGDESCVLLDKYEENPRFKYKMVNACRGQYGRLCFHSSRDGIHWVAHGAGKHIYGYWTDTLPCIYHDKPGKDYQVILRAEPPNPAGDGRGIRGTQVVSGPLDEVLASIDEKVLWEPQVLSSFILDKDSGGAEMFRRQIYSLSRTYLEDQGYLGVAQLFEFPERSDKDEDYDEDYQKAEALGLAEDFDTNHLYLMPSSDGFHFDPTWVYAGAKLLPPDLTQGYYFFSQAGQVLTRDGYHWFYYDRVDQHHHHRFGSPAEIALARFREGRLARLKAVDDTRGGVVVTQSFVFDANRELTLDVLSLDKSSEIYAELLPAAKSTKGMLDLLTQPAAASAQRIGATNGTALVDWIGSTSYGFRQLQDQKVHLRLRFASVYLYGFKIGPPNSAGHEGTAAGLPPAGPGRQLPRPTASAHPGHHPARLAVRARGKRHAAGHVVHAGVAHPGAAHLGAHAHQGAAPLPAPHRHSPAQHGKGGVHGRHGG
mmetsp:Transcript_88725/g.246437  ORF Transcript_88725/g.246437 Transcript_88725/m.246437 type:complete len:688 (+) Transcript_88725:44-2107(+)